MNEPIRVLHLFGALNPGGVETFVMNLYRNIDRSKIQFDFALTEGKKSFFDDEVQQLGGRIFYFDPSVSLPKNLSNIMREHRGEFTALHSHLYFFSGYAVMLAKKYEIPVRISHAHNTSFGQVYTVKRKIYERVMRALILRCSTHMFGCSMDACKFVFGEDCAKDARVKVIHNGFNVKEYQFDSQKRKAIRDQYGITDEQFVVGHVGRFEEQKNHTRLVEQFAAIKKRRPQAILLMVGRGSLMDDIKKKCDLLGILDACIFAGAQKDTPSYYSAMDAFLFPSLYEGLGSVLIEAQANGLQVFTSAEVVPEDINVSGTAKFISLDDSNEVWAEAVIRAEDRYINAEHFNDIIAKTYDMPIIAEELSGVYFNS